MIPTKHEGELPAYVVVRVTQTHRCWEVLAKERHLMHHPLNVQGAAAGFINVDKCSV